MNLEPAPPYSHPGDRWLFLGLLALLVWVPVPLGSNRPWAVALLEAWVFALAGGWLLLALQGRVGITAAAVAGRWVLVLLGVWLVYGAAQLVPLPLGWLEALSPVAAGHWAGASDPPPALAPASLEPHASLALWRLGAALFALFALILVLVRGRRRQRALAETLVAAAVAQSMLASLLALTNSGFWYIEALPQAHGTYPNRNHLAGFLEMGIALGIGLLMADLSDPTHHRSWRQILRDWTTTLLGAKARVRIYLAIMVITLVLTGSRMGNIAFFGGLTIAGLIGLLAYRRSSRPVLVLLASLLVVDLLILGSWFGLDRVRERLEQTVLTEESRYHVDVRALGYLDDFFWTGSGGGSFYAVFPAYRAEDLVPLHFVHAHNDFLEFQLEYGVPGTVLLALVVVSSLGAAIRVLARRHDPLARGMAFASLMGVTSLLIHSSADFNLRIPANAVLFVVLLALPWTALARERGIPIRGPARPGSDTRGPERREQLLAPEAPPGDLGRAEVDREEGQEPGEQVPFGRVPGLRQQADPGHERGSGEDHRDGPAHR